ncbi:hypothetical protein [Alkalilimnicola ehrlichii]|uniref:hypothetical protein n=1 Tax=Alkalilimnicola ehrlichii TaxID=351052 RepID=UPI003BA3A73F
MSDPLIRSTPGALLRATIELLLSGVLARVVLPLLLGLLAAHSGALAYTLSAPLGAWPQLVITAWWLGTAVTLAMALASWLCARALGLPAVHHRAALGRGLLGSALQSAVFALLAVLATVAAWLWLPAVVSGVAGYAADRALDPYTSVPGVELLTGLLLYGGLQLVLGAWLWLPMLMLLIRARPGHALRRSRRALYDGGWLDVLFVGPLLVLAALALVDFRLALAGLPLFSFWPALATRAVAESAGNPFQALARAADR